MSDVTLLHQALRTAVTLRDKVVVLRLSADAYKTPESVASLGAQLSVLRALSIRLVVLLDTPEPAARLAAAITASGQRALMLPATGIIGAPPPAAGPPTLPVTVDAVPLGQLTTIGYIPILLLPVTDPEGKTVNLAADDVATKTESRGIVPH